jgi:hypothetical protein
MRSARENDFRIEWNLPATIQDNERGLARPCILSNFSNTGGKITGVIASTCPDEFMLGMTPSRARKCRVLWRSGDSLGVEFIDCTAQAKELSAAREARGLLFAATRRIRAKGKALTCAYRAPITLR